MEWQFGPEMKNWSRVPVENLFDANIYKVVNANMQEIERTLRYNTRKMHILVEKDRNEQYCPNKVIFCHPIK